MQFKMERNFNERYNTSRGSLNNRLLPCPECGEDAMLTAAEIKAGKECDECVADEAKDPLYEECQEN